MCKTKRFFLFLFFCLFVACLTSCAHSSPSVESATAQAAQSKEVDAIDVFGVNPLFLYVLSEALSIVCWKTGWNGMLYNGIYAMVNGSCRASLCFALTHVVVCWAVGWPLYKRKIFIKI